MYEIIGHTTDFGDHYTNIIAQVRSLRDANSNSNQQDDDDDVVDDDVVDDDDVDDGIDKDGDVNGRDQQEKMRFDDGTTMNADDMQQLIGGNSNNVVIDIDKNNTTMAMDETAMCVAQLVSEFNNNKYRFLRVSVLIRLQSKQKLAEADDAMAMTMTMNETAVMLAKAKAAIGIHIICLFLINIINNM